MVKIFLVFLQFLALGVSEVHAQEFEISLNTSYIDTGTFNSRFSDQPNVEMSAYYDFGDDSYFEAYAVTGFERLFKDSSSEYGFEFGKSWAAGDDTSISFAAGRWMNYSGEGYDVGDWMFQLGLDHGSVSFAATILRGVNDTVLLHSAYLVEMNEQFSFTPSLVYDTQSKSFNPGFSGEFALSSRWFLGLEVVWAEGDDEVRRCFSNLSLIFRW